jgi:hypothetical protein
MIGYIPRQTIAAANEMLDDVLDVIIARLPQAVRSDISQLNRATCEDEIVEAERNLIETGIDWSRSRPAQGHAFFSTSYCSCIFCGRSVADRRGIEEHIDRHRSCCPVFRAIITRILQQYATGESYAVEQAERAKRALAQSRDLVLVDLSRGPEPRGQMVYDPRSGSEMRFAEKRLEELGFKSEIELKDDTAVEKWVLMVGDILILADPRSRKSITFTVWGVETVDRWLKGEKVYRSHQIQIPDGWYRDLRDKLISRIEASLDLAKGDLAAYYSVLPSTTPYTRQRHQNQEPGSTVRGQSRLSQGCQQDFLEMPHEDVLRKARSMSRKELTQKFNLTTRQASDRIAQAVTWEKSRRTRGQSA